MSGLSYKVGDQVCYYNCFGVWIDGWKVEKVGLTCLLLRPTSTESQEYCSQVASTRRKNGMLVVNPYFVTKLAEDGK